MTSADDERVLTLLRGVCHAYLGGLDVCPEHKLCQEAIETVKVLQDYIDDPRVEQFLPFVLTGRRIRASSALVPDAQYLHVGISLVTLACMYLRGDEGMDDELSLDWARLDAVIILDRLGRWLMKGFDPYALSIMAGALALMREDKRICQGEPLKDGVSPLTTIHEYNTRNSEDVQRVARLVGELPGLEEL